MFALLAGALTAFGVRGAPQSARAVSSECERAVVRDWQRDGRVDGVYPLSCYRRALAQLPTDVRNYSDAPDEIERALAVASNRSSGSRQASAQPAAALPLVLVALGAALVLGAGAGAAALVTRARRRPAS